MIRVLLADDHRIVREGLGSLLEQRGRVEIVAAVSNGLDALSQALARTPDVAVLDITMPGLNGIEVTHRLHAERPGIHVIILSMHDDRGFVLEALRAGARGYVLKDSAFKDLLAAIQTVMTGGVYLSPQITNVVVEAAIRPVQRTDETPFALLSGREREVLQMLAEGMKVKEIAGALHVSPKTIETHRKNIMDRLDLHSIAELTKYAVRNGLTDIK
ncbi:response regulator transcription factor [bacterium]|nr:response regulator transcription factor [candidate division CSSED10-310 bacterium]